jgi:hypothetical protein
MTLPCPASGRLGIFATSTIAAFTCWIRLEVGLRSEM